MEIGNAAQWASALLSAVVSVLAVWGDLFRAKFAGPKLEVTLLDANGERTTWVGPNAIPKATRYYHLRVVNSRRWAPAKNVRLVMTALSRPSADQSFVLSPLSGPLQFHWQFPGSSLQFPVLGPPHTSDLGHLEEEAGFSLSLYNSPNYIQTVVRAKERMRVEIRALADNAESDPVFLEIAWDGRWSEDTAEMRRHLIVKSVRSFTEN